MKTRSPKLEQKALDPEARFRAIFEDSSVGIALVGLDGHPLSVNPAIQKMTGYSEPELLAMTGLELSHPDDRAGALESMRNLIEGRQDAFTHECRFIHKDGRVYWVRQRISTMRGPDGKPAYIVVMVADIDEQHRMLLELEESEARFRAMFESSAMGVVILDLNTLAMQYNPIALTLLDAPHLPAILNDPYEFLSAPYRERERKQFTELLNGQRDSYVTDHCYRHAEEKEFWAHLTISAVKDTHGELRYVMAMLEDITEQKSEHQKLIESEARFQSMFDHSAVGMGLMSLDRILLDVNPAMCEMLGYTREELIGRSPEFVSFPEDFPQSNADFTEMIEKQDEHFSAERRYIRKNGEVFWARISMSLVRDANSLPLYLVGIINDIDTQKRAVEHLRESEARFRSMFNNAAVGISMMAPDRRVLAVNPVFLDMVGYSEAEMMNITGLDITYPEDLDIGNKEYDEILAGKRESYTIEKRYVRKDGKAVWTRVSVSAVRDSAANLLYMVIITEDIDQRKRATEELYGSDARFRAMYDNAAVGMAMMSLDRRIISINQTAANMTGYTFEELYNTSPSRLSHPDDMDIGMEQFREMVAGNIPGFQMEKRFIRKNGDTFWGRVTYSVVPGKNGEAEYLVGIIEDVTEQKFASQKLAEQEAEYRRTMEQRVEERTYELAEANLKLVDEIEQRNLAEEALASKAAEEAITAERTRLARDLHDAVTQTLFSASLIAEVLPDLWKMDVEEAHRSTEELRQLTRGALAEMRTLLLELRPATLTQARFPDLLRQLSEAVIGRARLPVTLDVTGDYELPPDIKVVFYRIAQESLNNIVKYARATQVEIQLRLDCCNVHLAVRDNGIGFDTSAVKLTSLGMRIMRERADSIKAHLTITSALGQGTVVSVDWNEDEIIPITDLHVRGKL